MNKIRFLGTYVPWKITKLPDNVGRIYNQYKDSSYGIDGLYFPIYEDVDKESIDRFKLSYAVLVREMMGKIAKGVGLVPFSVSPCSGMPENLIDVFALTDIDLTGVDVPPALLERLKGAYAFKELKRLLPFITTDVALYEIDLGDEVQGHFRGATPQYKDEELSIVKIGE